MASENNQHQHVEEDNGNSCEQPLVPSPVAAFIEAAAAASAVPLGRKGKYCCVVGCQNNQGRDLHRGIKFHLFPRDTDRRERWNRAVNRTLPGRPFDLWRASSHSVICSEHFVGGKKCNQKRSPSYIPTIFPTHSVKGKKKADIDRDERMKARLQQSVSGTKRRSTAPVQHLNKRQRQSTAQVHSFLQL